MFNFWRSRKTFSGGIHPPQAKEATKNRPIEKLPWPVVAVVPLVQHTGQPAKVLVKAGDAVKTGDLIGEADGFISANIHSPFTGVVAKIEPGSTISGEDVLSVIIEIKSPEEFSDTIKPYPSLEALSPAEIIEAIKKAGIVGLGGAAFPTHVKFSPPAEKKITTLLVNAAECEPYLNVDFRLLVEKTESVLAGAAAVQKALGVSEVVIGIEDNKPEAVEKISQIIKNYPGFRLEICQTKYPQGGEKQLIQSIFKKEVPSGGLPLDIGLVVSNVHTLWAIDRTLKTGWPLIERVVTVAGNAIKNPGNYLIRIGTSVKDVVEFLGGFVEEPRKIIAGGPMMGIALNSLKVPVVKGTSGLLFFTEKEVKSLDEATCLRCGQCVNICPMGLMPCLIGEAVMARNFDKAKELYVLDCMECGGCGYICPANRYLVQYIKIGKREVLKKK